MPHFVYVLRCSDGSFYVGHTTDVAERVERHNSRRGPAYTAARLPVELMYSQELPSMEAAVQREAQFKRWTRAKKEALIAGDTSRLHLLARRRG
jgi:predicted GIY-YIG superfamily endonuclease